MHQKLTANKDVSYTLRLVYPSIMHTWGISLETADINLLDTFDSICRLKLSKKLGAFKQCSLGGFIFYEFLLAYNINASYEDFVVEQCEIVANSLNLKLT